MNMLQNVLSKSYLIPSRTSISKGIRNYNSLNGFVYKRNVNISFVFKRSIGVQFRSKITPEKLRIKDNIPKGYDLIYRCTMSSFFYGAQYVCMFTTICFAILIIFWFNPKEKYQIDDEWVEKYTLRNEEYQMIVFSSALIIFNLSVFVLVSKFPIRIYFNELTNSYLSVMVSKIPATKSILQFSIGDVVPQKKFGVLPWQQNKYRVKNKRTIILMEQFFRRPQDLNLMLGDIKM